MGAANPDRGAKRLATEKLLVVKRCLPGASTSFRLQLRFPELHHGRAALEAGAHVSMMVPMRSAVRGAMGRGPKNDLLPRGELRGVRRFFQE